MQNQDLIEDTSCIWSTSPGIAPKYSPIDQQVTASFGSFKEVAKEIKSFRAILEMTWQNKTASFGEVARVVAETTW